MAPAVRELVLIDRQIGIEVGTVELRGDETVEEKGSARTVIEGALELSKLVWGQVLGGKSREVKVVHWSYSTWS